MKKYILIFATMTAITISCQKEISVENGATPTPTPTTLIDTSLISKIIGFDTTKSTPFDTTYIIQYNYDNFKRVVNIIYTGYNNSGSIDTLNQYLETQTNYYIGSDTLPHQTVRHFNSVNNEYNYNSYYQYTSNSILTYDSSIYFDLRPTPSTPYSEVSTFSISSNPKRQIIHSYFNNLIDTIFIGTTTQSGNILAQQMTSNSQNVLLNSFVLSYDTMINPFKKLNTWTRQFPNFLYQQDWIFSKGLVNSHMTTNNITKITYNNVNGSGQNFECRYVYKYNANRYPIEMVFRDMINGSYLIPSLNKIKFFYR
jgi:hypothetical protein